MQGRTLHTPRCPGVQQDIQKIQYTHPLTMIALSPCCPPSPPMNTPDDPVWHTLLKETETEAASEQALSKYLQSTVAKRTSLEASLAHHLACKLGAPEICTPPPVEQVLMEAYSSGPAIGQAIRADLQAVRERDSACPDFLTPFLFFKGFHALQVYRAAHWLWGEKRRSMALFLQNRSSDIFGVDIHPAADIGQGVMMDHATGIVIGETARVKNNVSIMQGVTLGGTGKEEGDRHPKVGEGVLISAGAKILGNIYIGDGAKVGAGSVVLANVPPHTTVAGIPAKAVGKPKAAQPALEMEHDISRDMDTGKS